MIDFFLNYWQWLLLAFVILDMLIVLYVIWQRSQKRLGKLDRRKLARLWQEITTMQVKNPRHAILDADKLVDLALGKLGYSGPLGQKLKMLPHLFTDNKGLWKAHLLRNRLAHELEIKLADREVRQAMDSFYRALKDLGLFRH